jgi:RNA polymerase sigma-70 factor (ECF subfamily)
LDDELIRQAGQGDQYAFRRLMDTYATLAERTALALLGDHSLAEDAVQEAWLDVWRAIPRFQLGRPFRPWLLCIVAHRARKQTRRRVPTWLPLTSAILAGHATDPPFAPWTWPGPADTLGAALRTLSPEQQQVLALRYFADLDLAEIARLTGVPVGTVKSRLHRALGSLRTQLRDVTDRPAVQEGVRL